MGFRTPIVLVFTALLAASCARYGDLGRGFGTTLSRDAHAFPTRDPRDPAHVGNYNVTAVGLNVRVPSGLVPAVLYEPTGVTTRRPAIVFLPGRFAPEDQYESYGRLLASHGFVVLMRGRYSWFDADEKLVRETIDLVDWIRTRPNVDASRIGVAGHSMGARDAITAAVRDPKIRAVVSIDPGGERGIPVFRNDVGRVQVPLLIIGAEVAWRGWNVCSPRDTNYEHFFAHAAPGTVELTIRGADHVQVMDFPDRLGYGMCRVGTVDSEMVRAITRRATAQFFAEALLDAPHVPLGYGSFAFERVRAPAEARR